MVIRTFKHSLNHRPDENCATGKKTEKKRPVAEWIFAACACIAFKLIPLYYYAGCVQGILLAVKHNCFSIDDELVIFPNPVKDEINVRYFSSRDFTVTVEIIDFTGKSVIKKDESLKSGNNHFVIETNELPSSDKSYFVQLKNQYKSVRAKFIK